MKKQIFKLILSFLSPYPKLETENKTSVLAAIVFLRSWKHPDYNGYCISARPPTPTVWKQ